MPRNGGLNGSHAGGQKGYSWTLKMEFPGFPDFGLCKGRAGSQPKGVHTDLLTACEREHCFFFVAL